MAEGDINSVIFKATLYLDDNRIFLLSITEELIEEMIQNGTLNERSKNIMKF